MSRRERKPGDLPRHVERALAQARGTDPSLHRSARSSAGDRALALIPIGVTALLLLLLMPRATPPDIVPLPSVDTRAVTATVREDEARAAVARSKRLPTDVLAVGSALRELNASHARDANELERTGIRTKLDDALRLVLRRGAPGSAEAAGALDDLLTLRAIQLEAFLAEVARFEATGEVSQDLTELGGSFVDRMRAAGWVDHGHIVLDDVQRRVSFKMVWNAITGLEQNRPFQLSLDEQRALYTLYLQHPHAPEMQRAAIDSQLTAAKTPEACERAQAENRRVVETWRADKIRKLGALDPSYPTDYALGVAYYRAGRYDLAVEHLRTWLGAHPEGPWSLRARNHLKAAVAAYGMF